MYRRVAEYFYENSIFFFSHFFFFFEAVCDYCIVKVLMYYKITFEEYSTKILIMFKNHVVMASFVKGYFKKSVSRN